MILPTKLANDIQIIFKTTFEITFETTFQTAFQITNLDHFFSLLSLKGPDISPMIKLDQSKEAWWETYKIVL